MRSANGSGQRHGIEVAGLAVLHRAVSPPTRDATTGMPHAIASTATRPKLS